jgi:hypothetical protein
VGWLVNGCEAINKREIVEKVFFFLRDSQPHSYLSYFRHSNFVQQGRGGLTFPMRV